MNASLYVYYKVDAPSMGAMRRAVMTLFEELRVTAGVSGRLAQRLDDASTWMEIYEPVADVAMFRSLLESRSHFHQLDTLVAEGSQRTIEIFLKDLLEPPMLDATRCA